MKKITFLFFLLSVLFANDITLGVTGNNRGLLGPCGCKIPSGGWARISTLKQELQPDLLIGAGNHFFHHTPMPKEDQLAEQKKALFQAEMFSILGYDVINAGQFDLCYGLNVLKSYQEKYDLPLISANIMDMNGQPAFPPYKIVQSKGITILFTGICSLESRHNFKIKDPMAALKELDDQGVFDQADLVVLLADAQAKRLSDFISDHDGIDLIIASKDHAMTAMPVHYKTTALVQIGSQGKFFGRFDVHFNDTPDTWLDISPERNYIRTAEKGLKEEPDQKKTYKRQLKRQKAILKSKIKKHPWYYGFEMIRMDATVDEDPVIREQVESYSGNEK